MGPKTEDKVCVISVFVNVLIIVRELRLRTQRNQLIINFAVMVSLINYLKNTISLSLDPPPPLYWEVMAEKRRVALTEAIDENERVSTCVYIRFICIDL